MRLRDFSLGLGLLIQVYSNNELLRSMGTNGFLLHSSKSNHYDFCSNYYSDYLEDYLSGSFVMRLQLIGDH